jgi:hypothetical protein
MSNYGHYNVKLAQVIGLEASVYLCELMNITEKAIRKNKIDDNFFTLDREYIQSRTTLDAKKQEEFDGFFIRLGILEVSDINKDILSLNVGAITNLVTAPDKDMMKEVKFCKNQNTKVTKKQAIISSLQKNIVTNQPDLVHAYCEWIEAVCEKEGYMHKSAVVQAQEVIDTFSNRNLEIAIKVIEIATINGYKDMMWAVNAYKRNYADHYKMATTPVMIAPKPEPRTTKRLSDEVF